MAVETKAKLITADELFAMPDDGMKHELVRGEPTTMMPPGTDHGRMALLVGALLLDHERTTKSGVASSEVGFIIGRDPDTVRAPDAAFIAQDRYDALGPTDKYWPEAPALAVEVVSPNDAFTEVEEKAFEWLDAGTRAVLVIDPKRRSATVYRARDQIVVYTSSEEIDLADAVPSWRLKLAELFS